MIERKTSKVENKLKEEQIQWEKTQNVISLMKSMESRKLTPKMINTATVIVDVADKNNFSRTLALEVTHCESMWNPDAIHWNDGAVGSHSKGAWQFKEDTFKRYANKMGEQLDYKSVHDQTRVAIYMINDGEIRQWGCSHMI